MLFVGVNITFRLYLLVFIILCCIKIAKNNNLNIDIENTAKTHINTCFEFKANNQTTGTLKFLKAGKYYINSQGVTTDLTDSNDKKVVDITTDDTIINWNVVSSKGYLVVVKVGS